MNDMKFTLDREVVNIKPQISISLSTRFWLFLFSNISSVLCSIFVLFHLLLDRTLRQALNNHIIIVLLCIGLIYELTTVPLMLYYFRYFDQWILTSSHTFTRLWTFVDYTCYATQIVGFAWASIERHILIFHQQWISTRSKCFFLHYLPIVIVLIYCFVYFLIYILFPTCEDIIDPSPFNGVPIPCMLSQSFLGKWDTICHQIIATFIIIISSSALLFRILRQKSRLNRAIQWRKQRKMTIQLLTISFLYLIFNFPRTIMQICVYSGLQTELLINIYFNSIFLAVYVIFFFPFVCCGAMPELNKKLRKIFLCHRKKLRIRPI
ncbi:unnamed protein product [Adineta ricciae]|uniref:G-protein coupled receptors family 1 profile domain-containing protein n=1 Tax=Adineta ricciae TaxID=249248 RepID=A0A815R8I6_ADIRI|nr:unnamed protein product [Adineta ricciae]CAF1473600.1 unnamed protein product [Adineta ricciae]